MRRRAVQRCASPSRVAVSAAYKPLAYEPLMRGWRDPGGGRDGLAGGEPAQVLEDGADEIGGRERHDEPRESVLGVLIRNWPKCPAGDRYQQALIRPAHFRDAKI
jgi:hypothetical protein